MTISVLIMIFFFSLVFSFFLAPLVVKLSNKVELTDKVNARSAHTVPTPRGGGLIFILVAVLVLMLNSLHPLFKIPYQLSVILLLSFACALLGFLDDRFSLPSWFRFFAQFVLALYPVLHMPLIFGVVPASAQYLLYTIAWVWFINLFNFMDGTDGYAAQESIFILTLLAIIAPATRMVSICLIGGCLGFLRVNYPKAKIFMGDAGSYFLGYLLFGLMLFAATTKLINFVPLVIISLLFTLDATATLIKRIITGERFWKAHRSHWYQRLYNLGCSHAFIFWLGVSINCLLLLLAVAAWYYHIVVAGLILAIGLLLGAGWLIKMKESTSLIRYNYEKQ